MVSPYPVNPRLPLGNTGRQRVRKEISKALRANPELRSLCKSVAPDIKKATKSQLLEMCVITGTLDQAIQISQENAASQAVHSSHLRVATNPRADGSALGDGNASQAMGSTGSSTAVSATASINESGGLGFDTMTFPFWLERQPSKSFVEALADDISKPPQSF
ncbi:AP-4 complex subunit epsilon-1 [Perkinsus olseni]|uniref:AP-4 complex subunit epsilon-1 n=1 Tax=Perkinsus olseni TaxID=32597 RepID=A0A7J6PF88_PEROL|nr:AP-4 complex subunit epsilon-1 [Perkinsus olseni]KAF4725904.1 AP-4 complex subunit epsilon-1 [Perkinsus olseni]